MGHIEVAQPVNGFKVQKIISKSTPPPIHTHTLLKASSFVSFVAQAFWLRFKYQSFHFVIPHCSHFVFVKFRSLHSPYSKVFFISAFHGLTPLPGNRTGPLSSCPWLPIQHYLLVELPILSNCLSLFLPLGSA